MPKIEITDEMVERAAVASPVQFHRDVVRHMLDSALNPPPEPDIEVTRAMTEAAIFAAYQSSVEVMECSWTMGGLTKTQMATLSSDIYRAMRKLEPIKSDGHGSYHAFTCAIFATLPELRTPELVAEKCNCGTFKRRKKGWPEVSIEVPDWKHIRKTDPKGPTSPIARLHRRKDDP